MQTHIQSMLLTEKYRPKKINDLVLPARIKDRLQKGAYQHLLFHGSAGIGKTSSAFCLVNESNSAELYINCSRDTSVDIVRNRILDFCSTHSLGFDPNQKKIVILDEIDGVSDQFFKALRATIEEFSANTRFVATCNYINKIPDPILSRFELISFDLNKEEEIEMMKSYMVRIAQICKQENIVIEKNALVELVKRKFPDLRSILNSIQGFVAQGLQTINLEAVKTYSSAFKEVYDLIFNNVNAVENYKLIVSNYSNRVDDVLASLGNDFVDYIMREKPDKVRFIPQIIIEVAHYQSIRFQVIDEVVCLLACVYKLQSIVNS